ncbi:NACHT domain-containing protein [Neorhizobium galegae]|uniref:NACHT domain-containing protein n=1 Tax=Neorhizobium galegae TaxID=399 RepID=UPI0021018D46|nr:NACHT domain-containing protein [Neorhizobium galegae]MCQ1573477.1 NACHT domain-containing protein [Neorhizobium galegae]
MLPLAMNQFSEKYKQFALQNYSVVKILGMPQSVDFAHIYTQVEVYDHISKRRSATPADLKAGLKGRGELGRDRQSAADVASNMNRLVLLGAPGSGKSTFLKSLALAQTKDATTTGPFPIIVSAPRLARDDNTIYLAARNLCNDILPAFADEFDIALRGGILQIMVDGLDEVRSEYRARIIDELNDLSTKFPQLKLVVTCRTAAYEVWLEKFEHYEISAFSRDQVIGFFNRWYSERREKRDEILRIIKGNESIYEICTSPLIATILCISFDDGVDVGSSRAEIYKEAVDTLIKKWDGTRSIYRDNPYRMLGPQRRADLLAALAIKTFVNDDIIFTMQMAGEIIKEFLGSVPQAIIDNETLDAEQVVSAIASQHGLLEQRSRTAWSFSHLTFHEYFAAAFAASQDHAFRKRLIEQYFDDADWKEVFSLIASLLANADEFVIDFMRMMTRLNFGKESLKRVENELWRASEYVRIQRNKADRLFGRKEPDDMEKERKKAKFSVLQGGKPTQISDLIYGIKHWKAKLAQNISSVYDDRELERTFQYYVSVARANDLSLFSGKNGASVLKVVDKLPMLRLKLADIWTPGRILRVAQSNEEVAHIRAEAAGLIKSLLVDGRQRRKGKALALAEQYNTGTVTFGDKKSLSFDELVIDAYNAIINETVDRIRNSSKKIRAYVAGEILFDVLNSSAYISLEVRKAGFLILDNFMQELPDPPDDGGAVVRVANRI